MLQKKLEHNEIKVNDPISNRRGFIKLSLSGGLLALVPSALASEQYSETLCESQASPLEAIISQMDALNRLQSELYKKAYEKIEGDLANCNDQFVKICQKVQQLKAEIIKTRPSDQIERLHAMTEFSCLKVQQLQTSLTLPAAKKSSQTVSKELKTVTDQIRKMAEELLPEGGTTLTAEATRILRELIVMIETAIEMQSRIDTVRVQYKTEVKAAIDMIQNIRTALDSARRKMFDANATKSVVDFMVEAVEGLKKLSTSLETLKYEDDLRTANVLILLVEGTKEWVKDPNLITSKSRNYDYDRVTYDSVSYSNSNRSISLAARGEIYDLLHNFFQLDF